jgi:hypothetical protein
MADKFRVDLAFSEGKSFFEKHTCFLAAENIRIKPFYNCAGFHQIVMDWRSTS